MKILVYGAGVIGGCLANMLCGTANEITVLARGKQKETLERDGLVAKNYFGGKTTTSHPRVIDALAPGDSYDVIFAVMQYQQMQAILPALAANASPVVVLVGNTLDAPAMEAYLHQHSTSPKIVVFGFQGTGGERVAGHYTYIAFGKPGMSVGSTTPKEQWLPLLERAFEGAAYRLRYQDNMDVWYKSHVAFVMPVCYICYRYGCDLTRATKADLNKAIDASLEGTLLLKHLGLPVPQSDIDSYTKSRWVTCFFYRLCRSTKIGELAASRHARNAVGEMIALNDGFNQLRAKAPDFPMPAWTELEQYMPKAGNEAKEGDR